MNGTESDPTHVRESIRTYGGAHALYTYDAQMAELTALRHRFETEQPIFSIGPVTGDRLLASLTCHIDHDEPPGLAARDLAGTVIALLDGVRNDGTRIWPIGSLRRSPIVSEAFVNKQLRLLLEEQTAAAFMRLLRGPLAGAEFTLLGYDFGPEGNVAYKTTVRDVRQLAGLTRGLLKRWSSGTATVGSTGDRAEIVDPDVLLAVHEQLTRELPAGVGYSLMVGSKFCTGYLSNTERHGVIEMMGKLATAWEQEART